MKYSRKLSEITIDGSYETRSDMVSVTVTSRGIPLEYEEVGKIFERGYRTDEARNQHPAGTGFGLYIAKRIVDIYAGAISAIPGDRGQAIFKLCCRSARLKGRHDDVASKTVSSR